MLENSTDHTHVYGMIKTMKHLRLHEQDGWTLVELMAVVVVIGILMAIAVSASKGTQPGAKAQAKAAEIDAASSKLDSWASQKNGFSNDDGTGVIDAAIAGQLANTVEWTDVNPPDDVDQFFVGSCGSTGTLVTCGSVISCLKYFDSGKKLCLQLRKYPSGIAGNPGLRTRRMVFCSPACTATIYTSTVNGQPTGVLDTATTQIDNGVWPKFPLPKNGG